MSQELGPVIIRPHKVPKSDLLHIFSIVDDGGRERQFYARKSVAPNQSLMAMKIMREQGEEAAKLYGIEMVLGAEAHSALTQCSDLTWDDLETIFAYVAKVMGGQGKENPGTINPGSSPGYKKPRGSKRRKQK